MKNFYLTTPIYYVNDVPHIGHAYTSIACDVLARFKRLDGFNVHFLTGTDEHGQKVEKSALTRGKTAQEFCDEISLKFREMANFLGISYDDFIRTTEERHKKSVKIFWERLQNNGWIYKDIYEGWYAVRDEAFYAEDELIDGKAPTGADVSWHKEESYFFRLSEFGEILEKLISEDLLLVAPQSKKNEVLSFIKSGLNDLSISRTSFKWGIPVPNDEKHIIYVWLDALVNYLSALEYRHGENYKKFWLGADEKMHIVGKDILRFHSVYWPAFLIASEFTHANIRKIINHDVEKTSIVMNQVFAHGWWTNEGQKISKSLGNVIDPYKEIEWIKSFGVEEKTAIDYFRYFLIKEVPFGNDGNYSREHFINRINAELCNNIGNLAQRSLTMIYKNCDGKIPLDATMVHDIEPLKEALNKLDFNKALELIIIFSADGNRQFNDQAPWQLKKENKIAEMNSILALTAENLRRIAILLLPFIANSANAILDLLNIDIDRRNLAALNDGLKAGHKINEPKIIFPRLEMK